MQQLLLAMVLTVVVGFSGMTELTAQCTPLDSIPGDAIISPLPYTEDNPENGIQDTACVDTEYETFIHIEVPDTVDLGALGRLPIDSALIIEAGITGTPAGFAYECNDANCVFLPNEVGCIRIFGTPGAGSEGEYSLEVTVKIFSGIFTFDRTLPDPTLAPGEYRLFVRENGNSACQPSAIAEQVNDYFSLQLAPNPAQDFTRLIVNSEIAATGLLDVIDATGRRVETRNLRLAPGENRVSLSTADWQPGLYTLVLRNGTQGVSTRLVVLP